MGDGIDGGTGGGLIPSNEVYQAYLDQATAISPIDRIRRGPREAFGGAVEAGYIECAEAGGLTDPSVNEDENAEFLEAAQSAVLSAGSSEGEVIDDKEGA